MGVETWANKHAQRSLCSSEDLDVHTGIRTWQDRIGYWSWSKIYILYMVGKASFCLLHTFHLI